jgi:uncharacterized membrane protein
MRLDALALSLSAAQSALEDNDRRQMIAALREVRTQSADVLAMLEGGQ